MSAESPITSVLVWSVLAAVVGSSFQFGYNTGVINAPQIVIEQFINETFESRYGITLSEGNLSLVWGITVSIFAVGGMIGSFCTSYATEYFGRKKSLLLNNILALTAALLMGLCEVANSYEMLLIGRFVIGINCGFNTGIAPLYLTEIAPVQYRGYLGTMNQLGIVTAILLAQVLGLDTVLGTEELWPLLLGLTGVFAIFQLIVLPLCPETPRYLLFTSKEPESTRSLSRLRGKEYDVTNEMDIMREEIEEEKKMIKIKIPDLFKRKSLSDPMWICITLQFSQQLSGINAVFYYSTDLFIDAGVPEDQSDLVTLGVGVVNIIMTLVSLVLIERAGRRILHLTGLGGMFFCAVALTVLLELDTLAWLSCAAVLIFVAFFQVGPGSIPWFITAELFNTNARAAAISVAGLCNWGGNFVVALAYPPLNNAIGGYTFAIFAALLAFFWIYTFIRVPETKGKTVQEITSLFETSSHAQFINENESNVTLTKM